jgi:glucose-6-phosphate 1-dehydrogenase
LDEELGTRGNRLFYLAVAPEYFADIIARLGAHGMTQSGEEADNWVRVVIEKPFGTDLASGTRRAD